MDYPVLSRISSEPSRQVPADKLVCRHRTLPAELLKIQEAIHRARLRRSAPELLSAEIAPQCRHLTLVSHCDKFDPYSEKTRL